MDDLSRWLFLSPAGKCLLSRYDVDLWPLTLTTFNCQTPYSNAHSYDAYRLRNNNNNNRSFNKVKTHAQPHAQPYKHIIHVYVYNEEPVSQDSNNAAHTHTLPRRTATTQGLARANKLSTQRR